MTQPALPPDITLDLDRVAQIAAERIAPRQVVAGIAGRHLTDGGGRLRAAVTLLAAQAGDYALDRVEHAAASILLIYGATRVHNELVDAGARRRGAPPAQARWGGSASLMVGDYLFALAAAEMALAPDQRIISYYSRSVMAICEAQMMPVMRLAPLAEAREQALEHARSASAALFEAAAGAGAVCGGLGAAEVEALARYGSSLGLAIHLAEDARDPQRAIRAGVITLPLIYAADAGCERLFAALERPPSDAEQASLAAEVRRLGGAERALDDARQLARDAASHVGALPAGPAREALAALADSAITPG